MGWASRVNPGSQPELQRLRKRLKAVKARVKANRLSDEDHRFIARLGPNLLKFIGYTPKVTLT